jgi:broad specificity phosphatase PhoE
MNRLLLVRHAEPSIDPAVAASEWSLAERGVRSASLVAAELARFGPTMIIASPERKAIDTARILSDGLGLPLEVDNRFSEHGAEPGEFMAEYGTFRDLVKRHFDRPDETVMRGESSRAAGLRFAEAVQDRLAHSPNDLPVIVSHGRIMSSWLGSLAGSSAWEIWTGLRMPDLIDVDLATGTFRAVDVSLV